MSKYNRPFFTRAVIVLVYAGACISASVAALVLFGQALP